MLATLGWPRCDCAVGEHTEPGVNGIRAKQGDSLFDRVRRLIARCRCRSYHARTGLHARRMPETPWRSAQPLSRVLGA